MEQPAPQGIPARGGGHGAQELGQRGLPQDSQVVGVGVLGSALHALGDGQTDPISSQPCQALPIEIHQGGRPPCRGLHPAMHHHQGHEDGHREKRQQAERRLCLLGPELGGEEGDQSDEEDHHPDRPNPERPAGVVIPLQGEPCCPSLIDRSWIRRRHQQAQGEKAVAAWSPKVRYTHPCQPARRRSPTGRPIVGRGVAATPHRGRP